MTTWTFLGSCRCPWIRADTRPFPSEGLNSGRPWLSLVESHLQPALPSVVTGGACVVRLSPLRSLPEHSPPNERVHRLTAHLSSRATSPKTLAVRTYGSSCSLGVQPHI